MLKRAIIISFAFVQFLFAFPATTEPAMGPAPSVDATYAIVIEASTGKELFNKNADTLCFPASTTKILTLITALENNSRNTTVTISPRAASIEGSSMRLKAGERYFLQELFYGMMMVSGNDAATAIAEHLGNGSVERFVNLMNATARLIGAKNSKFVNPSGLPDPEHYTTPRDMALITAYALKNPAFANIVGTYEHPWNKRNAAQESIFVNTNKFLASYDGATGVKTGYTNAARYCLVTSAEKNGVKLIAVTYHSDDYCWNDAWKLMDYGFSLITPEKIYKRGDTVYSTPVYKGTDNASLTVEEDLTLPVINDLNKYKVEVIPARRLFAPVKQGQEAGFVRVTYDGKEVRKLRLVSKTEIKIAS